MTHEAEDIDHRNSCSEEHEQIREDHREIQRALEYHIAEQHSLLVEEERIRKWDDTLRVEIEELATAVLGPRRSDFAGGGRAVEHGLVWQWHNYTSNGGVPAKLDVKAKAAIWSAVILGITNIIVQVLEVMRG